MNISKSTGRIFAKVSNVTEKAANATGNAVLKSYDATIGAATRSFEEGRKEKDIIHEIENGPAFSFFQDLDKVMKRISASDPQAEKATLPLQIAKEHKAHVLQTTAYKDLEKGYEALGLSSTLVSPNTAESLAIEIKGNGFEPLCETLSRHKQAQRRAERNQLKNG